MTSRKMILGLDRLDYSKGLEERFLGYEQFLAALFEARPGPCADTSSPGRYLEAFHAEARPA